VAPVFLSDNKSLSFAANLPHDMFSRSDSILTDEDNVPFDAQPPSKFGPIQRFIGPTSTVNKLNSMARYNINQNIAVAQTEVGREYLARFFFNTCRPMMDF
jgi:hypothetical protein